MTNRDFAGQLTFQQLCKAAHVKPTKRQASKFRNKTGKARQYEDMCITVDRCVNNKQGGGHERN